MIKLFLVEDEMLVRTNIKLLLKAILDAAPDSAGPPFTICGEAENGVQALALIPEVNPDIVLSDMKMPEMDGLELCKKLHLKFPNILFVALSNYDDYDYVRGILKNGGVDYVLKHELNTATLSALLTSLSDKIITASPASVSHITENSLNTLRKKFVLNLLSGMFASPKEITDTLQILSIPLAPKQVIPVVLSLDDYDSTLHLAPLSKQSVVEFSIENISNELLSKYDTGLLTHVEGGHYCLLLSFDGVHSTSKINETLRSVFQQISYNLKTYLNLSTSFGVGALCESICTVGKSYSAAMLSLSMKFYEGNQSIFHSKDFLEKAVPLTGLDYQLEKQLISLSTASDYDRIETLLTELFASLKEQRLDIRSAQMIFTDLIGVLTRVAKEKDLSLSVIFNELSSPSELLTKYTTLEQISIWFFHSFQALCLALHSLLPADTEYVRKAIAYINRNYAASISQQDVADEIGISCGYLSTIFKDETSQGFSDYLNSVRIAMAAKKIELGESNFREVAASCGFSDYSYFFKVFKKKLSITPKEYWRSHL